MRLKAALEARRNKRRKLADKVNNEKEQKILARYRQEAGNKVLTKVDEAKAIELANRLGTNFDQNEVVQAAENYIDKKT